MRRSGFHIRPVDRELFRYLADFRVATSHQIARDVYPGVSHQALYKWLNRLRKKKLIHATFHAESCGRLVYSLTSQGSRWIADPHSKNDTVQKSYAVLHDLGLVDIAFVLKRLSRVAEYYTESGCRELLDQDPRYGVLNDLRPDAAVMVTAEHCRYLLALEYEISLKKNSRYTNLFSKYRTEPLLPAVLYVCGSKQIAKRLAKVDRDVFPEGDSKIYYSLYEELFSLPTFRRLDGRVLTLGQLQEPVASPIHPATSMKQGDSDVRILNDAPNQGGVIGRRNDD